MRNLKDAIVLPVATGMSLHLCFTALRRRENAVVFPKSTRRTKIIWLRIDQKTCLKAILNASHEPARDVVVVECVVDDETRSVSSDLTALVDVLERDAAQTLCVVSTTSCFAPRVPDDVVRVAALCKAYGVGHVVNNAYGLNCSKTCHAINEAVRVGRVDAVVQSTDKNLMVPVGGSIVASPDSCLLHDFVATSYAGRASASPIVDVFVTLLQMGSKGFVRLRRNRIQLAKTVFTNRLQTLVKTLNALDIGLFELWADPRNTISFAVLCPTAWSGAEATLFGAMLFKRGVSGARMIVPNATNKIEHLEFPSYGSSTNAFVRPYFTLACAIGTTPEDVELLVARVLKTVKAFAKSDYFNV